MSLLGTLDSYITEAIALVVASPARQKTLHQFIKFGIIGVLNTGVDFAVYTILTRFF
jgi:hypothetical protein